MDAQQVEAVMDARAADFKKIMASTGIEAGSPQAEVAGALADELVRHAANYFRMRSGEKMTYELAAIMNLAFISAGLSTSIALDVIRSNSSMAEAFEVMDEVLKKDDLT